MKARFVVLTSVACHLRIVAFRNRAAAFALPLFQIVRLPKIFSSLNRTGEKSLTSLYKLHSANRRTHSNQTQTPPATAETN